MIYLTDKARRFAEHAINQFGSQDQQHIWYSWLISHPEFASFSASKPALPDSVARAVLAVLRQYGKQMDQMIEARKTDDDTLSDMENDLSLIEAIMKDLNTELEGRRVSA